MTMGNATWDDATPSSTLKAGQNRAGIPRNGNSLSSTFSVGGGGDGGGRKFSGEGTSPAVSLEAEAHATSATAGSKLFRGFGAETSVPVQQADYAAKIRRSSSGGALSGGIRRNSRSSATGTVGGGGGLIPKSSSGGALSGSLGLRRNVMGVSAGGVSLDRPKRRNSLASFMKPAGNTTANLPKTPSSSGAPSGLGSHADASSEAPAPAAVGGVALDRPNRRNSDRPRRRKSFTSVMKFDGNTANLPKSSSSGALSGLADASGEAAAAAGDDGILLDRRPRRRKSITSFMKPAGNTANLPKSSSSGALSGLDSHGDTGGEATAGEGEEILLDRRPRRRKSLTSFVKPADRHPHPHRSSATSIASLASSVASDPRKDDAVKDVRYYIEQKKWRKALKKLDTPEGLEEVRSSSISTPVVVAQESSGGYLGDDTGPAANALHIACSHGAPLEIIRLLCAACPDLAVEVDARGRTALHLLAASSSSSDGDSTRDAVDYLQVFNGGGVFARDDGGRLPLHAACRSDPATDTAEANQRPRRRFSGSHFGPETAGASTRRKVSLPAIRALYTAAPFALHDEDGQGLTPAEHLLLCSGDAPSSSNAETLAYLLKESRMRWELSANKARKSGAEATAKAEEERERWTARRTEAMQAAANAEERADDAHRGRELVSRRGSDSDVLGDLPKMEPSTPTKLKRGMPRELLCNQNYSSISSLDLFEETSGDVELPS